MKRNSTVSKSGKPDSGSIRVGIGYDVHQFGPNRRLVLGGVKIPHPVGLVGHSDGDVLLHAICDALLGASGCGDIGKHFPDTAARYRGISSLQLLRRVRLIIERAGFVANNVDSTLLLERPRIAPYVARMRAGIAKALNIRPGVVSVKATTNERLGFVGRGEGCAAIAAVSVRPKGA